MLDLGLYQACIRPVYSLPLITHYSLPLVSHHRSSPLVTAHRRHRSSPLVVIASRSLITARYRVITGYQACIRPVLVLRAVLPVYTPLCTPPLVYTACTHPSVHPCTALPHRTEHPSHLSHCALGTSERTPLGDTERHRSAVRLNRDVSTQCLFQPNDLSLAGKTSKPSENQD